MNKFITETQAATNFLKEWADAYDIMLSNGDISLIRQEYFPKNFLKFGREPGWIAIFSLNEFCEDYLSKPGIPDSRLSQIRTQMYPLPKP